MSVPDNLSYVLLSNSRLRSLLTAENGLQGRPTSSEIGKYTSVKVTKCTFCLLYGIWLGLPVHTPLLSFLIPRKGFISSFCRDLHSEDVGG
jgi:hypothetical protein